MLCRLLVQIKGVGRLGLHLERHFKGFQPRLQLRVLLQVLAVQFVQLVHQIQLPALFGQRRDRIADVFNQLVQRGNLGVDAHALINARQKSRLPVRRAARRRAARPQRNKPRHILIFRAQTVKHPRTHAWPHQPRTRVHHHRRHFMRRNVRVHRAHHAQVVHHFAQLRKNFADLNAGFSLWART